MSSSLEIFDLLYEYGTMTPLYVSDIFKEQNVSDYYTEENYYKILSRLYEKEYIGKLAKGIYFIPDEILIRFDKRYWLMDYSISKIFTGLYKGVELDSKPFYYDEPLNYEYCPKKIYTSVKKSLKIKGIQLKRYALYYDEPDKKVIEMLEILDNYYDEKYNHYGFYMVFLDFIPYYDDAAARRVIITIRYPKSTVSFLKMLLDSHHIDNSLDDFLAKRSRYKHPTNEEIKHQHELDVRERRLRRRRVVRD